MSTSARILIVEDDPDISFMLKLIFERKGFSTLATAKAEEVPEIMRNNTVHLVMMDMLLSGKNGLDICAGLKQNHETSHIPIVMSSAHPNAENKCKAAGADDFIAKPFEMNVLLSLVSRLIEEEHHA